LTSGFPIFFIEPAQPIRVGVVCGAADLPLPFAIAVSGPPGMAESALRLSVPPEGIRAGDVVLRFPSLDDVDAILPAFTDPELREAGNLPAFGREELIGSLRDLPMLAEAGRLLALAAVDAQTGEVVGGGTLHHLDAERRIVEIGYFVLPHARGRGVATTIARLLAEHAFSLGIERVAAYVNVGNTASERVVDSVGFTREGVVRSMPKPDGRRVDKTLYSLLPGE
jgi:RimJ/RimL family protein N-acetyltransferase